MVIKKVVTAEPILGYTALLYVEHQERPPPFLCTEKKMNQTHHRADIDHHRTEIGYLVGFTSD